MLPRVLLAAVAAFALQTARAQVVDPNLQNLLTALTQGTEVTMLTPLANGMVQITSFKPPSRMTPSDAAAAVESARQQLAAHGIQYPTADQFARALVGGEINTPSGPTTMSGVLPVTGAAATVRSQMVLPGGLPLVSAPSAAAGGSAPPVAVSPQAREQALQQLAAIGILNPSRGQLDTALYGGTISTVNGVHQLPGIIPPQR